MEVKLDIAPLTMYKTGLKQGVLAGEVAVRIAHGQDVVVPVAVVACGLVRCEGSRACPECGQR